MKAALWDPSGFDVSMRGKYNSLYELEEDIQTLSGSANFSELNTLDWFLVDKDSGKLAFLCLTVPSIITISDQCIDVSSLRDVALSRSVKNFMFSVELQDSAFFSFNSNQLTVATDLSRCCYKAQVSGDLYFLLDEGLNYCGFALTNATKHIPGYRDGIDDSPLNQALSLMLGLCSQHAYDAMDEKDAQYLSIIYQLENLILTHGQTDERLLLLTDLIENLKFTFYDLE
ncbi:hypothetical protein [Leminorella grimontii]|uniref:hypothetical protein n=1 Tax=Leminorella grimontii TaxID=82981 RepID=UPI003220234A